jgi:hypothetical protein
LSRAGLSVAAFGVAAALLGLIVLLIPNVLLELLGLPPTDEPWIRAVGVFVLALAAHYVVSGRGEAIPFIRFSVPERVGVAVGIVVLAALWDYWALAVVAAVPAAGAAWTWYTLRTA